MSSLGLPYLVRADQSLEMVMQAAAAEHQEKAELRSSVQKEADAEAAARASVQRTSAPRVLWADEAESPKADGDAAARTSHFRTSMSRVAFADESDNYKAEARTLVEAISPSLTSARDPERTDSFQISPPLRDIHDPRSSIELDRRPSALGRKRPSLRSSVQSLPLRSSIRSSLQSLSWSRSSHTSVSSRPDSTFNLMDGPEKLYRFQDLDKSWLIWVVRLLHGVYFLFAIVLIACIGINALMNMFLEFLNKTARSGKTLSRSKSDLWGDVLSILSMVLLLVLLFSGLLQRASWLLVDAVRVDMFHLYRRTLCCEGVGPGTFPKQRITVTVTENKHLRRVYSSLSWDCALERDILLSGTRVIAGAQLLADEAMEGKLCRDEVLDLEIPALLVFSVSNRALDLQSANPTLRMWAIADMIFQWLILASLDVIPLSYACSDMLTSGFFYIQWYTTLMTKGVAVACGHTIIYYIWSTVLDYKEKIITFRRLLRDSVEVQRAKRSLVASSSFCASVTSFGSRPSLGMSAIGGRRPSLGMRRAILAAYADETEQLLGACAQPGWVDQSPPGLDESLNVCLCIHNLLASRVSKGILYAICGIGICSNIAAPRNLQYGCMRCRSYLDALTLLAGLILLKVSAKLVNDGMAALGNAPLLITGDSVALRLWAAWFRVHCGITGANAALKAAFFWLASLLWTLAAVERGYRVHAIIGVILLVWFSVRLWWSRRSVQNHLWKLAVVQTAICTMLVISSMTYAMGWRGFLCSSMGALITQMGMARETEHKRMRFLFMVAFSGISLVVGTLTGVASAGRGGQTFSEKDFPWCEPGDADCKELLFPLRGSRKPYEFCSLSWPMGPENMTSTLPSTVHQQCEDTNLSLLDFVEMANLAYYLPNEADVNKVIAKYLPGWRVVHMQHYNANEGKYTTFIHISRGTTSVIAVRGTWAFIEALQDLNFWMPAAFVQLANKFGPNMLDEQSIMRAVAYPRALDILPVKKTQFKDLLDYTKRAIKDLDPAHRHYFYITGHSLGGGLAKVVGALLGIHAITFSSPGLQATKEMLNPRPGYQELQHGTVTVIADNDVVPMVDWQHGTLLHIDCPFAQPMECHGLAFTTCELLASCGDGGGHSIPRRYVKTCEECALSGQSSDEKNAACHEKKA